ncbi:MAG TPA: Rieske (2Fe-2S) protein [Acetobacteraceae bacterium]|jgi:Rieske Fe-S protein|nr:Rieske (2Fe-2S) protein [Acetobacteraceae bacterium]
MAGSTLSRRALVGGCIGARGVFVARADEPVDPDRMALPKIGDRLVEAGNEPGKTPLKPDDLGLHDLTLAWAFDPQTRLARDGSRLNMVLLMRFDPATLADAEREMAPGGVVAYSAVCTHQQCWVTDWLKSAQVLQCPCHQSRYDLRQGAKVVGGPAPRPLPALPLTLSDGALRVAGPFTDRVGGEKPGAA